MRGERHDPESIVLLAAREGGSVTIFGYDSPTHDGTCVRVYVHVMDPADAQRSTTSSGLRGTGRCHMGFASARELHERSAMTLNELAERVPVAMMTTINKQNQLVSRPMLVVCAEHGVMWFLTRADSGKMEEFSSDPRVNLGFASQAGPYASVSGRVSISHDSHVLDKVWNGTYRAWFPQGRHDPDIVLLRVKVERADYWDAQNGRIERVAGVIKAMVTGEPSEMDKQPVDLDLSSGSP